MTQLERQIKKLPDTPGVYLFFDAHKNLIYAGKATSLRNRVGSYFRDVIFTRQSARSGKNIDPSSASWRTQDDKINKRDDKLNKRPIEAMIHEVADIKYKPTDSVLEAIILEGVYIKKYRPKYNVDWRDDKSWNYIAITKDAYPRVVFVREHELKNTTTSDQRKRSNLKNQEIASSLASLTPRNDKDVFGPFPGLNAKAVGALLRRLFFVSDCRPNQGKPCFYHQIGQCLGVCVGAVTPAAYKQKVIRPLKLFLAGKKHSVIAGLEKAMRAAAKEKKFEEAARLRNQIQALARIQDIALLNKDLVENVIARPVGKRAEAISSGQEIASSLASRNDRGASHLRIEAYDISNLGESDKVGSMAVFDSQGPVKSEYRKFNIKTVVGQSDVDCLAEVISRRLTHGEWPLPDLFLLDGGRPQVNRIQKLFNGRKIKIPIVGIAKGPTRKKNELVFGRATGQVKRWVYAHIGLVIRARDEAHRFAIAFNRSKRKIKDRF